MDLVAFQTLSLHCHDNCRGRTILEDRLKKQNKENKK
jgi:hypothetical protein